MRKKFNKLLLQLFRWLFASKTSLTIECKMPLSDGNTIYAPGAMQQALEKYKCDIKSGMSFGYAGENPDALEFRDVSHLVTSADLVDNNVVVKVRLLDTSAGKDIERLLFAEMPLTVAIRGFGEVVDGKMNIEHITSFDVVQQAVEKNKAC